MTSLSNNIWWTRKARIRTEKRLLKSAFHSQVLLLWYSFIGTAVAIYNLKITTNSELDNITWVVFSILILCISGFINGLSFKERAGLIKECYESLHKLYLKSIKESTDENKISKEYEQILNACENHTDFDYYSAMCIEYLSHADPKNKEYGLDKIPTKYIWICYFWKSFINIIFLLFFYMLPILLLFLLRQYL